MSTKPDEMCGRSGEWSKTMLFAGLPATPGDVFSAEEYQGGVTEEKSLVNRFHSEVKFHVPGAVVGKGRPRIGRIGAHSRMFTPAKTANYESLVSWHAARAMQEQGPFSDAHQRTIPFKGPVQVNILIGCQIPTSWSKKKKAAALNGDLYPTTKPDLDNCIKAVFDAMNGVVYADDVQVANTVCKKRYREAPGLWVTVLQLMKEE